MSQEPTPVNSRMIDYRIAQLEKRADEQSGAVRAITNRLIQGEGLFATMAERHDELAKMLKDMKGDIRWATRLIMGAVLMAVVTLVLKSAADASRILPENRPSEPPKPSSSSSSP